MPDPVWFHRDIQVTLQQIGGARKDIVLGLLNKGAPMIPVTIDPGSRNNFQKLLESGKKLADPSLPDGHTNYYRSDDVAAVVFSTSTGRAACCRRSRPRPSGWRRSGSQRRKSKGGR